MKKLAFLLLLAVSFASQSPESPAILTLEEALKKDLIKIEIKGNGSSPHYAQPIKFTAKNLRNAPLNLQVLNGRQFHTLDEGVQDMLLVKSELIVLAPNEEKTIPLSAMCIQKQNRGPSEDEPYTLGAMAHQELLKLSQKIEEMQAYNTLGQYAVWSISNNSGLDQIAGFDEEEASQLQAYVSEITGRPIPKKDTTDYRTNYNRPYLAKRTVGGKFEYGLVKPSAVTIGLFNEDNIIVRELLNKPNTPRGDHKLNFEFDMATYTDSVYFVRLIIDKEIKLSFKLAA
ncbi:MAG: hypothetical protein RIC95_05825 [Vicingaceae bacterium]